MAKASHLCRLFPWDIVLLRMVKRTDTSLVENPPNSGSCWFKSGVLFSLIPLELFLREAKWLS